MTRTYPTANLFPLHLDWTESTCYYVTAIHGFRMALLSGPYRTSAEAETALPSSRRWALKASGDTAAASYQYLVHTANTGHSRSILGELPPPSGNLARFDDYEINPCQRFEEPDSPGRFYFEVLKLRACQILSLVHRQDSVYCQDSWFSPESRQLAPSLRDMPGSPCVSRSLRVSCIASRGFTSASVLARTNTRRMTDLVNLFYIVLILPLPLLPDGLVPAGLRVLTEVEKSRLNIASDAPDPMYAAQFLIQLQPQRRDNRRSRSGEGWTE
jgi:hypothetical protein